MSGSLLTLRYVCSRFCGFSIGEGKYNSIVQGLKKNRSASSEDSYIKRLTDLNNLGRKQVAEDFSDMILP